MHWSLAEVGSIWVVRQPCEFRAFVGRLLGLPRLPHTLNRVYVERGPAARQRRRVQKRIVATTLALMSVMLGVPAWLLFPPQGTLGASDAIMVIAGYSDGRHQLGAQLIEEGISQNYVVSNPLGTKDKVGSAHCRGVDMPENALHTWCLGPEPVTTTGEALTMGKLAEAQGWTTATVVTNRTHARRVSTMFEQCTNLDATVIYRDYIQKKIVKDQVLHEIGGYIKFWLTNPC